LDQYQQGQHRQQPSGFLRPLFTTITGKSNPAEIRLNNCIAILNLLFPAHALSRAEISRHVKLSRVSVSQAVSDMLRSHLLVETGQEDGKWPGKHGTLLRLDTNYWNIICLDLSQPSLIRGAVTDIAGHVLIHAERSIASAGEITVSTIEDECRKLMAAAPGHVLGIGVATPGIIDSEGTILDSSHLELSHVRLGEELHQRFSCPCFVDNDTNSALLAVRLFDDSAPNMIYVQITRGVGAAVLINDSIVIGADHAAGEIGHVVVDPHGPVCDCGKRGCLETFLAAGRLRSAIARRPQEKQSILRTAGSRLGQVLASPASLLNIDEITVFGPLDVIDSSFIDGASHTINSSASQRIIHRPITVRRCELGSDVTLIGESISVLQDAIRLPSERTGLWKDRTTSTSAVCA
jgi:transcriptional regulator of PTS gene